VVLRARIVLTAAQGSSNVQIARELGVNVDTVRLWRDRWAGLQGIDLEVLSEASRLQDVPRPGVMPKFTTKQRSLHLTSVPLSHKPMPHNQLGSM